MKQQIPRFTCDKCGKQIIPLHMKFPYPEGWCYLYNFNFQVPDNDEQDPDMIEKDVYKRYIEQDKHFCSKECMKNHLIEIIDKMTTPIKREKIYWKDADETFYTNEEEKEVVKDGSKQKGLSRVSRKNKL